MINLKWVYNEEFGGLYDGMIDGKLAAFIQMRPHYCDRGHWHANIEMGGLNIDHQDMFPRYYMRLAVAKQEIEEFLDWRINKVRSSVALADLINARTI